MILILCHHHQMMNVMMLMNYGILIKIVNPTTSLILVYGMLAVRLLPRSSISNLIVITDGMITLADIQVIDSVLNQLRCISVACSFMHVSSQFHPHSCHGHVPYSELMQLIATATMGTYLNTFPDTKDDCNVNYYHEKFIMWTFRKGNEILSPNSLSNNTSNLSCTPPRVRQGEWTVKNTNFYGNRQTQLVSKRQINDHMQAHLDNIVCCRMREGFIVEDIQFKDSGSSTVNSKLQLKFVLPWTNHIYIEYDLTVKWPPPNCSLVLPIISQGIPVVQSPPASGIQSSQVSTTVQSDSCLNIHYTIIVKGPYEFLRDITCGRNKKLHNQNLSQSFQQCQYQLSSYKSSTNFPSTSTTITSTILQSDGGVVSPRGIVLNSAVSSKYRQALITRFWSTMRSIAQTDLLIKHLETYSPSTGHLVDFNSCNQSRPYDQSFENQLNQKDCSLSPSSPNSSSKIDSSKILMNAAVSGSSVTNFSSTVIPNRSPLRSGMPLFYHLPSSSSTSALKQQLQVKLNDQQQNFTDLQHQQYADFWRPVCTLDPDVQWPRWFSTYRIGGGVLLLRHDRPLPRWLHIANSANGRYQTLTCRKAAESLFAMLKQWCTFVLIDDHSYVKCLNKNETFTGSVSFCIARVTLRPPCCCCIVLHLAFQSCVPAIVHHKIVDDLKKRVLLLDSTMTQSDSTITTSSTLHKKSSNNSEHLLHVRRKSGIEKLVLKKNKRPKKYIKMLEKPLEKILIRYERMPSQFTTVIFPDGSQPNTAVSTTPMPTNFNFSNTSSNNGRQQISHQNVSNGVECLRTSSTTTTTLSRYLYHRRWIWSSGQSLYNKSITQQQLQQQLARTLSLLTKIRLREGFRFAHSSAGVINMVLQVHMSDSSLSKCISTGNNKSTSHCVIQYVLFPPHIISKLQPLDNDDVNENTKTKVNDDNRSLLYSSDEEEKYKKQEIANNIESISGAISFVEDDYQLITECWIEPQHGSVIVNGEKNNKYMSGLSYEQLPDAMWLVDADCIGSLYTFQHMQQMCLDPNVSTYNFVNNLSRTQEKKKKISIDDRIYKLPFEFSLVNLLTKCHCHSSITFNLFSTHSTIDGNKLNTMLECAFYAELCTINDRSFDVNDTNKLDSDNLETVKIKRYDNGQCYVKRVNSTRLILTVTPLLGRNNETKFEFPEQLDKEPTCRLRANTWHCNRNGIKSCPQSLDNAMQDSTTVHYNRAMSVGSKPKNHNKDMSWAQFRIERNFCPTTVKGIHDPDTIDDTSEDTLLSCSPILNVMVYDCQRIFIEHALVSKNVLKHETPVPEFNNSDECYFSSSTISSDEEEESFLNNEISDNHEDGTILDKYLLKVQQAYDRCLVTTVFRALHLGLDVRYLDVQCAVDRCQHQLITFDITDYIRVVCGHFKNNCSFNSCPEENKTLKLHHDMIRSKFDATLHRHRLQSVPSHPDYYYYCCSVKNKCSENNFINDTQSSSSESISNIRSENTLTESLNEQCLHEEESEEQELTPLFVHLVCSVKTSTMSKSSSVRSLPTCIFELLEKDKCDEISNIPDVNLTDVRVSLDIYCLILANTDVDIDNVINDKNNDIINKTSCIEPAQIMSHSTFQKPNDTCDDSLLSSLPIRYARGLAAFIKEVEWCMQDEMAAGLLEDTTITPGTLDKVIQHVSNSSMSSSNGSQKIPVNFVEPPLGSSYFSSMLLFIQQLDQMDIKLDQENGGGFYELAKSTDDTFYVVKKKTTDVSVMANNTNFYEKKKEVEINSDSENCLIEAEQSRPSLPNFWIILKIQSDTLDENNSLDVLLYFHCRFTELDVRGRYAAVREVVRQHICHAATIVNQTLLLCRLHDTRMCDPLLEPITENHIQSDDDDTINGDNEKKTSNFTFGQFRCPIIWTAKFILHPRLQQSSSMLLLGVQVLHSVLDKLSVKNRRNMFVYREESSGSVFYLRLYENTNQQHQRNMLDVVQSDTDDDDDISRCSSATSTTATIASSINHAYHPHHSARKPSDEFYYSIQTPGTRSLGGYWGEADSKEIEDLTLKVYGISPVGTEIRVDLVEVLQNRLNDAVLEVLTTMLYRNPVCRLYPDDVRFVQPIDSIADCIIKFSLPSVTKIKEPFVTNLQRNAVALLLYPPKYASRHHRFVVNHANYLEKPIVRSFFIYNQQSSTGIGGIRTSGNRGLACVLFEFYYNNYNNYVDLSNFPTDSNFFEDYVKPLLVEDESSNKITIDMNSCAKIHIWRRGRINMEALLAKLSLVIKYTLWDINVEQFLKNQPVVIKSDQLKNYINPLYIKHLAKWIAFGAQISAPLACHSQVQYKISINHVLREFKTHISWSGVKLSNNSVLSVRYFYIPRSKYGIFKSHYTSSNLICGIMDPLQLDTNNSDKFSWGDLLFHEWESTETHGMVTPPSATCVIVLIMVITQAKSNKKRKRQQNITKIINSDTNEGLFVAEDDATDSEKEEDTKILTNLKQLAIEHKCVIQDEDINNSVFNDDKKNHKPSNNSINSKISKFIMLTASGCAIHTLSYNWNKNDDQSSAIQRLCNWLEWRRTAFTSSILHKMGLINNRVYGSKINDHSVGSKNSLDLLLDYKSYTTAIGDCESQNDKFINDKICKTSGRIKHNENEFDDKKNKPLHYEKDVQDIYIEQLVKTYKQQRRFNLQQKYLYELWTQNDVVISKETLWTFYRHSRLLHYCLTPLLFLPRWRLESAATRDHSLEAGKSKISNSQPAWHKKLCSRFNQAYAEYIETHSTVIGFRLIQVGKQHISIDSSKSELDTLITSTCYLKKSVPGINGGLLLIETGVNQPFYYFKLSCVERARLTNNSNENDFDDLQQYSLLDHSDQIMQNMHLHSFTYDFHVRVLSDRLNKLIKNKFNEYNNYYKIEKQLVQNKNCIQKVSKTINDCKINAIAGFLNDFLKYYKQPPLYSRCLVHSSIIERTHMPVTGRQLYEYLLSNSNSQDDSDGISIIKISGYIIGDEGNGKSLFDDSEDLDNNFDQYFSSNSDLSDYVLVHQMTNSDNLNKKCCSKFNSNSNESDSENNETKLDCEYEDCSSYDATLVMSLSSKQSLISDTRNEIIIAYYILLTVKQNINVVDEKKEVSSGLINHTSQSHSTSIYPNHKSCDQSRNVPISASVPCGSYGYMMNTGSTTCWGSLDNCNSNNNWCPTPPNTHQTMNFQNTNNELYSHRKFLKLKNHLVKCYGQRASKLVAHAVDKAAGHCRIHMLWRTFSMQADLQKPCSTFLSFEELEELVMKAGHIEPLALYDPRIEPILEQLLTGPQWFNSLQKLLVSMSSPARLTIKCRLYSSNNSDHQYLVVLPAKSNNSEVDVFILINNGNINKMAHSISIVYRKIAHSSEDLEIIVEAIGRSICYLVWRAATNSTVNITTSNSL
ncbi:KICSTOR complex protein SZT2-like isoform X2 [Daktulosphaira vitifoliae]|uniref:KICSTOR complex protein SZT2-like isoform X2 n=1 Tax=Daktulosphaira vitifoliae TaxID=58002 RepID=UPI0021AAD059|nr:KICSTOR complex protein SZT2-like isoform X2 [Daktulosphaira vitifoliae]